MTTCISESSGTTTRTTAGHPLVLFILTLALLTPIGIADSIAFPDGTPPAIPGAVSDGDARGDSLSQGSQASGLELLPETFETPSNIQPNRGQLPTSILYGATLTGYTAVLYQDHITLIPGTRTHRYTLFGPLEPPADFVDPGSVTIRFLDANPHAPTRLTGLTGASSFYYDATQDGLPVERVPHGRQVTYAGLWPGIDLVFRVTDSGHLEYLLRLAPGARSDTAKLGIEGVQGAPEIDGGTVHFPLETGTFWQTPPVAYPEADPDQQLSARPTISEDGLSFHIDDRDPGKAYVIDPTIAYSTAYGGTEREYVRGIAVDSDGNAYVIGTTDSPNFAEDTECVDVLCSHKQGQAYIAKFGPNGTLRWTHEFGGRIYDYAYDIALSPDENSVYVGGINYYRSAAFIRKVSYAGGFIQAQAVPDAGRVYSVAVHPDGTVYTAATVYDDASPLPSGYQTQPQGNADILLTRHSADLQTQTPLTYYGSPGDDAPVALEVGPGGSLYIAGTANDELPLVKPFQTHQGGEDGFIARFTADGTILLDATHLGGTGRDLLADLALDPQGNVYALGNTGSTDFPTTPTSFNPIRNKPVRQGFVVKFDPGLSSIAYSTFLGGGVATGAKYVPMMGIDVTPSGAAVVTGSTGDPDFPRRNAIWTNPSKGGDLHVFALLLTAAADDLVYATTLPKQAESVAYARGIAIDPGGAAYVVGETRSYQGGPSPPPGSTYYGPIATGGSYDGFVMKLSCIDTGLLVTPISECPSGPALQPRVHEDSSVEDTATPASPPPCEATVAGCTDAALGYSDFPVLAPSGVTQFTINLSDFDGHNHVACDRPGGCTFWLDLNVTVSGTVEEGIEGGSRTTAGLLSVRAPDGTWNPLPDADLEVRLKVTGSGVASIEIPDRLWFNGSSLPAIEQELRIRITPQINEWDPQGDSWNVTVNAAQVQLVAPPTLIVHGWTRDNDRPPETYGNGTPPAWEAEMEAKFRGLGLARYGQDPWAWGPNDDPATQEDEDAIRTFSYHSLKGFRRVAEREFRQHLEALRPGVSYAGSIDVVAFSMGGLVSRWAIEDPQDRQPIASDRVGKLVAIGTPHMGSDRADGYVRLQDTKQFRGSDGSDRFYLSRDGRNLGLYLPVCPYPGLPSWCVESLVEWRAWYEHRLGAKRFDADDPKGWDMSVVSDFELKAYGNPVLDLLNTNPGVPGVPYYLMAGEVDLPTPGVWGLVGEWAVQGPLGDVVVPTESATLDGDPTFTHKVFQGGFHHGQVPEQPEIQTSAFDFLAGIPIDQDDRDHSIYEEPTAPKTASKPWWLPPLVLLQQSGANTPVGTMASGPASTSTMLRVNVTFNVTGAANALFETLAPNGTLGGVSFKLIAPNGSWSASNGNGTLDNVVWNRSSGDGFLDRVLIHVPAPSDGIWTLEAESKINETVEMQTTIHLDSFVRLEDHTRPSSMVGEPVILKAAFLDGDTPLTGATVNASVEEPLIGRTLTVTLADDGIEPDQHAHDGIYTAQITPLTAGNHPYIIRGVNDKTLRTTEGELATALTPQAIEEGCTGWLVNLDQGSPDDEAGRIEGFVDCVQTTITDGLP